MLRYLTNRLPTLFLALILGSLLNSAAVAEEPYRSTGLMLKGALPTGEFGETQDLGFGMSVLTRSHIGHGRTWFHGQASYMRFPGSELQLPSATTNFPDATIFGISLGMMAKVADYLYIGAEGGYYFGDDHSWGLVPFVSAIRNNIEVMIEYKPLGSSTWFGISAGYYLF